MGAYSLRWVFLFVYTFRILFLCGSLQSRGNVILIPGRNAWGKQGVDVIIPGYYYSLQIPEAFFVGSFIVLKPHGRSPGMNEKAHRQPSPERVREQKI